MCLGLRQELARHKREQQQRDAATRAWHHAAATFCPRSRPPSHFSALRRGDSAISKLTQNKFVGRSPRTRKSLCF